MNFLRLFVLAASLAFAQFGGLGGLPVQNQPAPVIGNQVAHAATHHISLDTLAFGTECSATAIGPHALLTAAHCDIGTGRVTIDDADHSVVILHKVYDNNEHMILELSGVTFKDYAQVDERAPRPSERVYMWGNPGKSRDVYREGYSKRADVFTGEDGVIRAMYVFVLPIFDGDSGSGVFDDSGKVITTISIGNADAESKDFLLMFTPEQLLEASR